MTHHAVTPTRRNAVLGAIQAAGLDPIDFTWEGTFSRVTVFGSGSNVETVDKLVHVPTGYWFQFDLDLNRNGSPWSIYLPGPNGVEYKTHSGSWDYVFSEVQRWLGWVAQEHRAPDLWQALRGQRGLLAAPVALGNTPFTVEEQAEIGRQLGELITYLGSTQALTEPQITALQADVDYLIEASTRLGRIDWRNALAGALIGHLLSAAVPASAVQHAFAFVTRALGHLWGLDALGELPP